MILQESAKWPKYPLSREQVLSVAKEIEKKKSTWVNIGYVNKFNAQIAAKYRSGKINPETGEPFPIVEILKYSEAQYMSGFNYGNSKQVKARNATAEWQARHPEGTQTNSKISEWIVPNVMGVSTAGNEVISVIAHPKNTPNRRYFISIDGSDFEQVDVKDILQYLTPSAASKETMSKEDRANASVYKDEEGNGIVVNYATFYVSNIYAIKGEGTLDLMQNRRKPKEVVPPQETITESKDFDSGKDFHYKTPLTDDDVADILKVAEITSGHYIFIDDEYVGIGKSMFGDGFDIYYKDTLISTNSKQEAISVLKNLENALKDENDKQEEFIRYALPILWKGYKKYGFPEVIKQDELYSDLFKDTFGRRPRSAEMIEFEIQNAADNLGITVD